MDFVFKFGMVVGIADPRPFRCGLSGHAFCGSRVSDGTSQIVECGAPPHETSQRLLLGLGRAVLTLLPLLIIYMYDRFKSVEQVLGEVEAWYRTGVPVVFFADDNFVGHRAYAKELLRELEKWNAKQSRPLSFYTQASIDMVRDEKLLTLLRKANFNGVFVGIESPRKSSLAEARKTQNEKLDLVEAVHTIQPHNIFVMAGMIAGFDNDDPTIFDEQFDFC